MVNARLLITCDTAFYAIIVIQTLRQSVLISVYIYNLDMLVGVATKTRMGVEFYFLVKDSTKTDMTEKQSNFSLHFIRFVSLA